MLLAGVCEHSSQQHSVLKFVPDILLHCRAFAGSLTAPVPCMRHTHAACQTPLECLRCRALAAGVAAFPLLAGAARADDQQGVASSRMSYSRFLEYLDMGRVKKVGTAAYADTGLS